MYLHHDSHENWASACACVVKATLSHNHNKVLQIWTSQCVLGQDFSCCIHVLSLPCWPDRKSVIIGLISLVIHLSKINSTYCLNRLIGKLFFSHSFFSGTLLMVAAANHPDHHGAVLSPHGWYTFKVGNKPPRIERIERTERTEVWHMGR